MEPRPIQTPPPSCGVVLYQLVFGALPFHRTLDGKPLDFKHNMRCAAALI